MDRSFPANLRPGEPCRRDDLPALLDAGTDSDRRANDERALAALEQLGCTLAPLDAFPSGQEVARLMRDVDVVMFTTLTLDSRTSLNPVMSLTGHPSVAVPNGFAPNGSPAGIMFSGHLYREDELMALAKAFQDQNRQYGKLPPLVAVT